MSAPPPAEIPPTEAKAAGFFQLVGAVFWSFLGVRKGTAMSRDMSNIKPVHVILVGVMLAAILVFCLIGVVRLILHAA
jgi:uncharacterized membrane protein YoaK (UPF0700 family)